jgi:hypothetical protein
VPNLHALMPCCSNGLSEVGDLPVPPGGVNYFTRAGVARPGLFVISVRYLQAVKKRTVLFFTADFRTRFPPGGLLPVRQSLLCALAVLRPPRGGFPWRSSGENRGGDVAGPLGDFPGLFRVSFSVCRAASFCQRSLRRVEGPWTQRSRIPGLISGPVMTSQVGYFEVPLIKFHVDTHVAPSLN